MIFGGYCDSPWVSRKGLSQYYAGDLTAGAMVEIQGLQRKKVWSHDRSQSLSDLQSVGEDICSPPKTLLELDFRVTVLSPRGREMVQAKDLFSSVDVVEERLEVVIGPVQQSGKLESDPGVQILVALNRGSVLS